MPDVSEPDASELGPQPTPCHVSVVAPIDVDVDVDGPPDRAADNPAVPSLELAGSYGEPPRSPRTRVGALFGHPFRPRPCTDVVESARVDLLILALGTLLLLWKMHAFVLPSQIAAARGLAVRTAGWERLLEWFAPWRWQRGDLLRNTTPTGGDMGAHVWAPDFVRRSLFSQGRLTGWSNDWFAGFPVLQFYFPLPMLAIALASFVLPYGIAFKLVSVAGIVTLPWAMYRFGRVTALARPIPLFLGLSAFVFLFGRWYDLFIYGGGILPTMAGEFSFSIGLSLAITFLGSFIRLLRTGFGARRTALLLTATGLSHLLPTLWALSFASVFVLITLLSSPPSRSAVVRRSVRVALTSALLGAWWVVPFAAKLDFTNDMAWEKATRYRAFLFPFLSNPRPADAQLVALACILAIFAMRELVNIVVPRRTKSATTQLVGALACGLAASGLLFRYSPQHRLWNARILPFWFLIMLMLAAIGAAHLPRIATRAKVAVGSLAVLVALGLPLSLIPGWLPVPRVSDGLIGFQHGRDASIGHDASAWTKHNFAGYESSSTWPEYRALMNTASQIGKQHGCGRVMWEHEEVRFAGYGTTLSLMLLPYWTKGCMGSIDGVYFESSATLSQHWITAALVSAPASTDPQTQAKKYSGPTNPQRNLPYPSFDLARALPLLRSSGVRYFLTATPETQATASSMAKDFTPVGSSGPYTFFRVADSELVRALFEEPVVVRGVGQGQDEGWLDVGMAAFTDPTLFPTTMTASGPREWQRAMVRVSKPKGVRTFGVGVTATPTKSRPLPPVRVSNIRQTNTDITFDVDLVGVPVAVNTSYFPNWRATGARGPYRSVPNFMIVIPTSRRVRLHYGYSASDRVGFALTLFGVVIIGAPHPRSNRRFRRVSRRNTSRLDLGLPLEPHLE